MYYELIKFYGTLLTYGVLKSLTIKESRLCDNQFTCKRIRAFSLSLRILNKSKMKQFLSNVFDINFIISYIPLFCIV